MAGRPEPTYRLTIAPGLAHVKSDMLAHQTPGDSFLSQEALPVGNLLTLLVTRSQNQERLIAYALAGADRLRKSTAKK